ncbi:PREDICTED: probable glutamate--tRNA ligase, mitochondrial [Priapulus caudatus]|uniref:Nondiscriminating glutamyl-tRNA synthetase EARS2, mitochondrial n=1 Tax=Priapulus caudatus TaxID=37621 RepID=A0ABM1E8N8_PRICU|nr:PREDICTED: probable glutamate--tRNA ligase, mitochondrial [Priapulus caudatus]
MHARNLVVVVVLRAARQLSSEAHPVRVRFAPSPTGQLHLGGLRTALYNYLFAKSHGGTFILRIEDTDQTRLVPGAQDNLESLLTWAGLIPDEGPTQGGDYGPYVQSQRLHLYRDAAQQLIDDGSAYYCFCTEQRLRLLRREALRNGETPRYDNRCRHLSRADVSARLADDAPRCVRFRLTASDVAVDDLVIGASAPHDVAALEGDPVVVKADGGATYHLASVVDDRRMRVSHVLRGCEWRSSTAKHVLLYRALGWSPPAFGHLPLLVDAGGAKLSKRRDDASVGRLRDDGFLPDAVLNYVARAGGGFGKDDGRARSLADLVTRFDIARVNANPSRLEPERLLALNGQLLQRHLADGGRRRELCGEVRRIVGDAFGAAAGELRDERVLRVLDWAAARIRTLCSARPPGWKDGRAFAEMLEVLGKEESLARLRRAAEQCCL